MTTKRQRRSPHAWRPYGFAECSIRESARYHARKALDQSRPDREDHLSLAADYGRQARRFRLQAPEVRQ